MKNDVKGGVSRRKSQYFDQALTAISSDTSISFPLLSFSLLSFSSSFLLSLSFSFFPFSLSFPLVLSIFASLILSGYAVKKNFDLICISASSHNSRAQISPHVAAFSIKKQLRQPFGVAKRRAENYDVPTPGNEQKVGAGKHVIPRQLDFARKEREEGGRGEGQREVGRKEEEEERIRCFLGCNLNTNEGLKNFSRK